MSQTILCPPFRLFVFCLGLALSAGAAAQEAEPAGGSDKNVVGPIDLALEHDSPAYGGKQPYRLYLPSAYDGKTPVPLLVALHGTGGDENKYFDHEAYSSGIYKQEAEKRGFAVLCPLGTDALGLPTEWRGIGENNVLNAIEDACRRFRIDRDRIVCTGQSMGGTGTTYLCCNYPDLFAAGIPLASTYGHVSLVTNVRHVPMLYVQGANDWPIYAQDGPIPLSKELARLSYEGSLWMIPGEGHNTMKVSTDEVFDFAASKRLVKNPRQVTFRTYLPTHGRAYWIEIQELEEIGPFAEIDATIEPGNRIVASLRNASRLALRPNADLLDLARPIAVVVNGDEVFRGLCSASEEIRLEKHDQGWKGALGPLEPRSRTAYRTYPIGTVVTPPTWEGNAETTLGNLWTDATRDAVGAEIAFMTRNHYRGVPLKEGQTLYLEDLFEWLRPMEQQIVTFEMTGAEFLKIIEENLVDNPKKQAFFLVHVSGCRYAFDRSRPAGDRVTSSDINPEKTYRIACEPHLLTRTDTLNLSRRGTIDFQWHEPTTVTAAWRAIAKAGGKLESRLEGRITDETPPGDAKAGSDK